MIKTLFAPSGNVCAFRDPDAASACEERLTNPKWKRVKARVCHIRGLMPDSARYDAAMTDEQRNSHENLILLCPNHHTVVDDLEPERFTVEYLTHVKERHEEHHGRVAWASAAEMDRVVRQMVAQLTVLFEGERYLDPLDDPADTSYVVEVARSLRRVFEGQFVPFKFYWPDERDPGFDGFVGGGRGGGIALVVREGRLTSRDLAEAARQLQLQGLHTDSLLVVTATAATGAVLAEAREIADQRGKDVLIVEWSGPDHDDRLRDVVAHLMGSSEN